MRFRASWSGIRVRPIYILAQESEIPTPLLDCIPPSLSNLIVVIASYAEKIQRVDMAIVKDNDVTGILEMLQDLELDNVRGVGS